MLKDPKTFLVPKLRFPEFRNEPPWVTRKLGELFRQREETGRDDLRLLSLTDKEGIIPQEESNRKNNASVDRSKYLRVARGDIVYNTMRMWEGRSALATLEGIVSPAYTVCEPCEETNSLFFAHYFKTSQLVAQFARYSQGLVKDTLNLKFEAFARILAPTPSPAEQQKIAECLSTLDELIEVESRKLDALKDHKKGLMQQLFPREGETRPRLRFPEFRNTGDWRAMKLNDLAEFLSGGTPSKENPAFWNGSIPWASARDMKQLFLDDTEKHISAAAVDDGAKLAPSGSLLMLIRGMTLLKDVPICLIRREMSFNQDVKALRPLNGVNGLFLAWLLTSAKGMLLEMVTVAGHGTGRLDTDALRAIELRLPNPREQHCIATCLSSLDELITAQGEKLEALRTHKRGLMQQLFPSPDAIDL